MILIRHLILEWLSLIHEYPQEAFLRPNETMQDSNAEVIVLENSVWTFSA